MPLPTEFPKVALATLLGYANGNPPDAKTTALAVYELEGYLLSLYFGDVQYPKGIDLSKLLLLAASPEFSKAQEAVKKFAENKTAGLPLWKNLLQILATYGPQILALILKLIALAG